MTGLLEHFGNFCSYFQYLKNPIPCLMFKCGIKKEVTVKFKNTNKSLKITDVRLLNTIIQNIFRVRHDAIDDYVEFNNELYKFNETVEWLNVTIYNFFSEEYDFISDPFYEFFYYGHYNSAKINYKNRVVIDIGSFIGDTALFFAKNGAEVYAFDPVKKNYDFSLKIRELNPSIKNKIHFFNNGVSDKRGKVLIDSMNSTVDYRNNENSYEVNIITIEDILNENNIKPDILKIDCEGCEYNIILNTDLSAFNDIIFEHHQILIKKDYNLLIDKLKSQGFEVEKLTETVANFEEVGLIHAYRK